MPPSHGRYSCSAGSKRIPPYRASLRRPVLLQPVIKAGARRCSVQTAGAAPARAVRAVV